MGSCSEQRGSLGSGLRTQAAFRRVQQGPGDSARPRPHPRFFWEQRALARVRSGSISAVCLALSPWAGRLPMKGPSSPASVSPPGSCTATSTPWSRTSWSPTCSGAQGGRPPPSARPPCPASGPSSAARSCRPHRWGWGVLGPCGRGAAAVSPGLLGRSLSCCPMLRVLSGGCGPGGTSWWDAELGVFLWSFWGFS